MFIPISYWESWSPPKSILYNKKFKYVSRILNYTYTPRYKYTGCSIWNSKLSCSWSMKLFLLTLLYCSLNFIFLSFRIFILFRNYLYIKTNIKIWIINQLFFLLYFCHNLFAVTSPVCIIQLKLSLLFPIFSSQ